MDIVAGLLTSKAEEERKLAEARGGTSSDGGGFVSRQLRRTGLSKAQALSSLASLADWVTWRTSSITWRCAAGLRVATRRAATTLSTARTS